MGTEDSKEVPAVGSEDEPLRGQGPKHRDLGVSDVIEIPDDRGVDQVGGPQGGEGGERSRGGLADDELRGRGAEDPHVGPSVAVKVTDDFILGVHQGDDRGRTSPEDCSRRGIRQRDVEVEVDTGRVGRGDWNGDRLGGDARGEFKNAALRGVIGPGNGGPVTGRVADVEGGEVPRAGDGDLRGTSIITNTRRRSVELDGWRNGSHLPSQVIEACVVERGEEIAGAVEEGRVHAGELPVGGCPLSPVVLAGADGDGVAPVGRLGACSREVVANELRRPDVARSEPENVSDLVFGD